MIIGAVICGVLIIAGILIFHHFSNNPSQSSGLPATVSAAQAYQLYQQGAFFLDVRSVDEWNIYHVPGSTLIPLDQLSARTNEVPPHRQIVVVCATGHRSPTGRDILLAAGFSQVTCLTGGLTTWSAASYPLDGTRP